MAGAFKHDVLKIIIPPDGADDPAGPNLAARAAAVRSGARVSIAGMAIMTAVLVFVGWHFAPLVSPAWALDLWLAGMYTTVGFWLVVMIAFTRRQPDDEETVRDWPIYGRITQNLLNIGIAASPWVLLRGAGIELQFFTTVLYVWYVAVIIASGDSITRLATWEVVLLTGSVAGFSLVSGGEFAQPLAALLVLVGVSMLGLRAMVQRTVLAALQAEQISIQSEKVTREALGVIADERDAKSRFIASASHDLQQPVYAARLGLEAALRLPAEAKREEALHAAASALGSAQTLIDTMLEYLRLDEGDVRVKAQALAVDSLLDSIAAEYRPAGHAVDMGISVRSFGRLMVCADPQLLRRAIGNLVHNAIRHSGATRLLIAARQRPQGTEIWVIDNGCGLSADNHLWLFQDFAKGNVSMRRGLGLGLASARRQLGLMAGSICVDSRWKRGTAFVIRLPAAATNTP